MEETSASATNDNTRNDDDDYGDSEGSDDNSNHIAASFTSCDEGATARSLTQRTVLVVDDNMLNLEVCTLMLKNLKYNVLATDDPRDALRLMSTAVDCVLTDLHMPNIDGAELTRRVRREYPNVPILVLTADITPEARKECLAAGANTMLHKPLFSEQLAKLLDNVLDP